jgi:hypothetical protein
VTSAWTNEGDDMTLHILACGLTSALDVGSKYQKTDQNLIGCPEAHVPFSYQARGSVLFLQLA